MELLNVLEYGTPNLDPFVERLILQPLGNETTNGNFMRCYLPWQIYLCINHKGVQIIPELGTRWQSIV